MYKCKINEPLYKEIMMLQISHYDKLGKIKAAVTTTNFLMSDVLRLSLDATLTDGYQ